MSAQDAKRFMINHGEANNLKTALFTEADIDALPPEFKRLFNPIPGKRRFNLPVDLDRRFRAAMMAVVGRRMGFDMRRFLTPHTDVLTPDMKTLVDASLQLRGAEVLTIVLGRMLEAAPPPVIEKIQKDIALKFDLMSELPSQHDDSQKEVL